MTDSIRVAAHLPRRKMFAGGGGLILASAPISSPHVRLTAPAETWRSASAEARARSH